MNRVTAQVLCLLALTASLAVLTGCSSINSGNPNEPAITSFTASPTAVTAGATIALTGVFARGTGVITPGNIPATSGTAVSVTPTQTTTYILTVTSAFGDTAVRTATVTVNSAAPAITSFTASPATITAGGAASLTGVFTGGTGMITPGNITATSGQQVSVTPTDTTTYTLTVTNTAGTTVTKTAVVTVNPVTPPMPAITSFTASPATIAAGGAASLTGVFTGGTSIITPGEITATTGQQVSVTPTDTTTYTLTVTNTAGITAYKTATVTVNPPSPPAAPTNLSAAAGNATVGLSWTGSAGATTYNVYRSTTSGGEGATPIATGITTVSYNDTGLTNDTTYYYKVAAVNSIGTSPMSNEASAKPSAAACSVLTATDTGVAEIDLTWDICPGATSYYILRSTTSGGPYTTLTVSTGTSYQDFGLVSMQKYYYVVQSINSSGMNVESNEANATFTSKYVSQDANGWTTVMPSPNGKQYYVSSSTGNDSTGDGSQAKPYASIKKAAKLVLPGYPDWILLKAGDIWYDDFGDFEPIGGLSADEPMVFTSYGTGPRPQMRFTDGGDNVCFGHFSGHTFSHFYFIGLECYDSRKDPSSPDYESSNGKATASDTTAWGEVDNGDDILVEDNYFHFTAGGIDAQLDTGPAPKNIRIRRNIITDIYSAYSTNPQGFFLASITNLLVEDNLFDHNAWNDQAGDPASVFDHHMYIVDSYMTTVRNNLMLRDESLSLKLCSYAGQNDAFAGALVYNNLIFEGEVGISMGYGASTVLTGSAFTAFKIDNNVLLQVDRDNPTKRGLGWGIDIQNVSESYFTNNIFSQFDTLPGGNTYAFDIDRANPNIVASGNTIQDNLIYQDAGEAFVLDAGPTFSNIKIQNNTIQNTGLPTQSQVNYDPLMYLESDNSLAPYSFSGDTYYNAGPYNSNNSNNGFAFIDTGDILDTYNQWLTQSGETGSQIKQITYPDPNRTLESYDASLGGATSFNPILAAIRSQSRATWNPAYTAEAINDYIRNGFNIGPLNGGIGNTVTPPAPVTTLSATPGNNSVTLNWTAPAGNPTFYIVYRGTTVGGENMVSPVATYVTGSTWTDTTAANGSAYYYQVASMNAGGFGGLSNEASAEVTGNASLIAQTITFTNPGAQTVGTPLTLVATASSTLTVSFTSTTTSVCTVSGGIATFLTVGTCTIDANQAGNGTYAAATMVPQSFMVNNGSQSFYTLPSERTTLWQPGVTYNGGIPTNRTQCGTTVTASGDKTGATDPVNIQKAIDACTAGHFVLLGPGTFYIAPPTNAGIYIQKSNITLRGSNAGVTVLNQVGKNRNLSVIVAGFQWYHWPTVSSCDSDTDCTDVAVGSVTATSDGLLPLTADTVKETDTTTVATSSITNLSSPLVIGELFHLTEQFDPNFIWYNPEQDLPSGECGVAPTATAANVNGYCGWGEDGNDFMLGTNEYLVSRPIGQANVLTKITTNGATTTLTFAAPWHHAFRVSHAADLARISNTGQFYTGIGIENLTVANGGDGDGNGNIVFGELTNSWIKNVESYNAVGGAIEFEGCFRCEVRDSYLHTAGNPNPGGGGYGMEIDTYTSDSLFENNISWSFNKVMVMRGAGGGNVIGYNYFEDGYGAGYGGCEYGGDIGSVDPQGGQPYTSTCDGIPEAGMNATHMTGTQYALFEGNQSFNIAADGTWGNATYITFFRNHAPSIRRNVNNGAGTITGDPAETLCSTFSCFGPVVQLADTMGRDAIGLTNHQWWYSYVGNVLGYPNNYLQNPAIGYAYPATFSPAPESATWFYEWNGVHNDGAPPGQNAGTYWISTLWILGNGDGTSPDAPSTIPGAGQQTVLNTLLRDGNFDYVTNKTLWMGSNNICNAPGDAACAATNTGNICTDQNLCAEQYTTAPAVSALPNSLYIPTSMQPPAFFNGGAWPWVDGTNAANPLPGTLPARTRFDAGTPNTVPTLNAGGSGS